MASAPELGRLFGLSETRSVSLPHADIERVGRGRYPLAASLRRYVEHLRKMASARGGEDTLTAARAQRTRLLKAQGDAAVIKAARARGELVSVAEVEREWTTILGTVRRECSPYHRASMSTADPTSDTPSGPSR